MKKLWTVFFALLILSSCKEKEVAVESVTIDQGANTSLRLGETLQLKATVLPDKATSKAVTWSSSNPSTATISAVGLVTPVAEGETIISAGAGGITAKCTVKVLAKFVLLTALSFTPDKENMAINQKKKLTPLFIPGDASEQAVDWSSDKEDIATVNGGEVEAKKAGTCKITAKSSKYPTITATCEVTVFVPLTAISFNPDKVGIVITEKKTLEPLFVPGNASDKTLEWKSDKEDIAIVSNNGEVEAKKLGTCKITAKSTKYPAINGTCEITVVAAAIPLTGLTISPLEKTVEVGDTFQLQYGLQPANATTNTEVTFVSSDLTKATVTETGRVTALVITSTPPPLTITVKSKTDPSKSASCTLTIVAATVRVQSILIAPDAFTFSVGQKQQLTATVLPVTATDKTVTWSSADPSKATVSTSGEVTAVAPGQVEVTATANDGSGIVGKSTVTVIPVATAIAINPAAPVVGIGRTITLTISVTPDNASKAMTWTSSAPAIATIDLNTGLVTGVAVGTTTITAAATDGSGKTATTTVTVTPVTPPITAITINPAEPIVAVLGIEKTLTLTVSVTPANASQAITWTSSAPAIATINAAGIVTGVAIGETIITATATDGSNVSATKTVTVKSSDASLTTMTLAANYPITLAEGQTVNLYHAARTFYADISAVPVTITLPAGATVKIGTVVFASGQNVNFANPVAFVVTAEDGATTKTYTVGIPAYNATTNPYGIYTAAQLSDVRNALDKNYKLMNDIALPALSVQAATDLAISDYSTAGWKPLGDGATGYTGTFDGNNHLITNLRISRNADADIYIGLFGVINSSSVVKFLGVVSEGVNGNAIVGVLTGQCRGDASILNSSAAGPVTGRGEVVGGLCGLLGQYGIGLGSPEKGTISNCYASATPTGNQYVGGLVGNVVYGIMNNCYATGTPVGRNLNLYRYGFTGDCRFSGSRISRCFATGGYGLTVSILSFGNTISGQAQVTNSYYPAQSPGGDCGTAVSTGATQATFDGFDFSNTWTWTNGQWPKLKNVPGTQPTVNLP